MEQDRGIGALKGAGGQRNLALAGLVAPLAFALGVFAAGVTWEGYSHRTQNISDLGGTAAPYPVVQNLNFALLGLLVVALAVGQRRAVPAAQGAISLLVGYFGLTAVVMSVTPCSPGCADGAVTDIAHSIAALTGFLALVLAALLTWRRGRSDPGATAYARYSVSSGIVALVFLAAWFVASGTDPEALQAGLVQRVFVGVLLLWLAVTALRLLRSADGRVDRGAQASDSP